VSVEVPATCAKCGVPLLPRPIHRFGVALGIELAFALLLAAAFVPFWWARIACGSGGIALLAYAFASNSERGAGQCPRCKADIVTRGGR